MIFKGDIITKLNEIIDSIISEIPEAIQYTIQDVEDYNNQLEEGQEMLIPIGTDIQNGLVDLYPEDHGGQAVIEIGFNFMDQYSDNDIHYFLETLINYLIGVVGHIHSPDIHEDSNTVYVLCDPSEY